MVWSLIQIEKDVKRINERINEVVKALGTDSKAYNDYVSRIKSLILSSLDLHEISNGINKKKNKPFFIF